MQYLRQKLREGMDRIAREHPSVDFSISTSEVNAAEDELDKACERWRRFEANLSEVQRYFKAWEAALLKAAEVGRPESDNPANGAMIRA